MSNDFTAGLYSGLISSIICNPFDVIRTNYQLKNKINYNVSYLYRGISVSLLCIPTYWSVYFSSYNKIKDFNKNNYLISNFSGYFASCISSTIATPLFVIRQKYQVEPNFSILNYYKSNGILSFYAGLKETYMINLSFLIQMPLYEYLKSELVKSQSKSQGQSNNIKEIFAITAISKTVATLFLYPLDTIRTHIRSNIKNTIMSTIKKLNKNPISYYYGMNIYLLRSIPYHAITFSTYEYFKNK